MAEEGDSGSKTEEPTGRKLGEARNQGMVGVSVDFSNVFGMTGAFIALQYVAPELWNDFIIVLRDNLTSRYSTEQITPKVVENICMQIMLTMIPPLLVLMGIAAFCGAGCTAIQTKFLWSWQLIKPKWFNINPVAGLKRIISINNWINILKALAKFGIIAPIAYYTFLDLFPGFMSLMTVSFNDVIPFTAMATKQVYWKIIRWLFMLAILDLCWQKWRTKQKLKMSKHEVKDERKSIEGDDATRRRIIAIGLQRTRSRMLKAVKTADVVVTNPTHIAVALEYTGEPGVAPKVIAKGKGLFAERIKQIAREAGVPVVEKKPLARALFKMVEVGQEIPYELFRAVAELLAYVYRVKGKIPKRAKKAMNKKTRTSK